MQIIKVRFLKEDKPTGKEYTYYSPVAVKPGDIVQINSAAKGIVTEIDVPEAEIAAYRDKVKTIMGLMEEKPAETFDPEKANRAQIKYCREHSYPHFAPAGRCWRCGKNIYEQHEENGHKHGISVERAGRELITGCPHCCWSFCE